MAMSTFQSHHNMNPNLLSCATNGSRSYSNTNAQSSRNRPLALHSGSNMAPPIHVPKRASGLNTIDGKHFEHAKLQTTYPTQRTHSQLKQSCMCRKNQSSCNAKSAAWKAPAPIASTSQLMVGYLPFNELMEQS